MTDNPAEILLAAVQKMNLAVETIDQLLSVIDKLEIERNTWRFRSEKAEKERNQWEARAGEWEARWQEAAARAARLAAGTGGSHCPNCGSDNVLVYQGDAPTGVVAPDGGAEYRVENGLCCQSCGHVEDLT
jgi:hypothetical protein